ncbi:TPA: endonuclease III [Candidatus Bathyarchaeota archaeon]|nr:endonuclease III [Candidatus Bathyarchaeota archaeon]HIJ08641.1 endonuclease III [Candidatus Bathyarchaeota archaeon]
MNRPVVYLDPKDRAAEVIRLLEKEHPDATIALRFGNPLELLISTILSAQATDEQINKITPKLFKKYQTPEDYANAELEELQNDIRSSGFYRNKAKNIKNCCKMLVEKYNSQVPRTMADLVELPGVARKTANIVLTNAYGIVDGIAVDTHVQRLSQRLGLTERKDPVKIEIDLMRILPKENWECISDLLIFHGRRVCFARKPNCPSCVLNKICPSAYTFE